MSDWFTLNELAALKSPALPDTVRDLQRLASQNGWQGDAERSRLRDAKSGAVEYHVSLLPAAARADLFARETLTPKESAKASRREALWLAFDRAPEKTKAEARRRLTIVQEIEAASTTVKAAIASAATRHRVSQGTLFSWLRLARGVERADRLAALTPRHAGRQATADCAGEAWEFLKSDWLRQSQPAFSACYRRLADAAAAKGWTPIPSAKTLQRRLERELPRGAIVLARKGGDAARALFPAQTRDRSVFHAMEAVNVDGHKFDVFVKWPDGTVGRPMVVAFQDLHSNLFVAHRLDRSENRDAVRLALGDMVESHGIPEHVYFDNGRAFASKWITGRMANRFRFKVRDDEPTGILTELGVQVHWTTPYSGQSKPIERAFRELAEEIARHPKCEGAYTGNRPDAKPENYGSKAVPFEQFEALVAAEIARFNLRAGRRTKAAGGKLSFADVYKASLARETTMVRRATETQRRLFLLAAEGVTTRDNGEVNLAGNRYWTEELLEVPRRKVIVRFDPADFALPVHVYTLDGRFVATAECIELTGFADTAKARAHAALRRAFLKKLRDIRDLERLLTPDELAAMLPEAEPVALPAPKVVRMVQQNAEARRGDGEAARDAFNRGAEKLFGEVVGFGRRPA